MASRRRLRSEQSVGVLVGAALPRTVRIAEVDRPSRVDAELCVLRPLGTVIPRERLSEVRRQRHDGTSDRLTHGRRPVTRECRPVLVSHANPVTRRMQARECFSLTQRQVAPRADRGGRTQMGRRHPAMMAKPTRANRRRNAGAARRILARETARDRFPQRPPRGRCDDWRPTR